MPRPRKTYARPGPRHQLTLSIQLETWLAFQDWCRRHGKIASQEIEEYMARTVAARGSPPVLDTEA
jgi:hypothetical protein